jgi:hypothetical protein
VDPLIIDIVDYHRSFQGQARQRILYYKKCGYKVKDGITDDSDDDEKVGSKYAFVDED